MARTSVGLKLLRILFVLAILLGEQRSRTEKGNFEIQDVDVLRRPDPRTVERIF